LIVGLGSTSPSFSKSLKNIDVEVGKSVSFVLPTYSDIGGSAIEIDTTYNLGDASSFVKFENEEFTI
jgi:hypothetical protein